MEQDTDIGFVDEMNGQDKMEKLDHKFINAMTKQTKISAISVSVNTNCEDVQLKLDMSMWTNWQT